MDEIAGLMAEMRLKEISKELEQLRNYLDVSPNNQYLIDRLLQERREIMKEFIRIVKDGSN
jgi:hypothetical protein